MERDPFILDRIIIISKAHITQRHAFASCKSLELIVAECAGQFAGPVRTEVKEDHRVIGRDFCHRLAVFLITVGRINSSVLSLS